MTTSHVSQPSPTMKSGEEMKAPEDNIISLDAAFDVSQVDERKLMRKIDLHLIPWLSLLYLLSFLDRTSIGNAKVFPHYFPYN